jgi:tetratricopeptide (TPR) repeat protein
VHLNRPRQARSVVEPHLADALRRPDESLPILSVWATALVADGQHAEARRVLEPLLATSTSVLKDVWFALAARTVAPDIGAEWLEAAEAPAASRGVEGRVALAGAWFDLAMRDGPRRDGHLARARSILEQTVQDEPNGSALVALGEVAGEMGDLDRAESAFRAAAAIPETKTPALRGLAGVALSRGGDPAAAIAAARLAVESSQSRDPRSLRLLGDARLAAAAAAGGTPAARSLALEAAGDFLTCLDLTGETPPLLDRLARAYDTAGDHDKSIAAQERIVALPSSLLAPRDRAAAQNNLAYSLVTHRTDRESLERARRLAQSAAVTLPIGPVLDTLGVSEAALGNRGAAIDAFRRSLADRPDAPSTLSRLAELLAAGSQAERDDARRLLAEAERASSGSAGASSAETAERLARVRKSLESR